MVPCSSVKFSVPIFRVCGRLCVGVLGAGEQEEETGGWQFNCKGCAWEGGRGERSQCRRSSREHAGPSPAYPPPRWRRRWLPGRRRWWPCTCTSRSLQGRHTGCPEQRSQSRRLCGSDGLQRREVVTGGSVLTGDTQTQKAIWWNFLLIYMNYLKHYPLENLNWCTVIIVIHLYFGNASFLHFSPE